MTSQITPPPSAPDMSRRAIHVRGLSRKCVAAMGSGVLATTLLTGSLVAPAILAPAAHAEVIDNVSEFEADSSLEPGGTVTAGRPGPTVNLGWTIPDDASPGDTVEIEIEEPFVFNTTPTSVTDGSGREIATFERTGDRTGILTYGDYLENRQDIAVNLRTVVDYDGSLGDGAQTELVVHVADQTATFGTYTTQQTASTEQLNIGGVWYGVPQSETEGDAFAKFQSGPVSGMVGKTVTTTISLGQPGLQEYRCEEILGTPHFMYAIEAVDGEGRKLELETFLDENGDWFGEPATNVDSWGIRGVAGVDSQAPTTLGESGTDGNPAQVQIVDCTTDELTFTWVPQVERQSLWLRTQWTDAEVTDGSDLDGQGMITLTEQALFEKNSGPYNARIQNFDGETQLNTVSAWGTYSFADGEGSGAGYPLAEPDAVVTPFETPIDIDVTANDSTSLEDEELELSSLQLLDAEGTPTDRLELAEGVFEVTDGQVTFTPAAGFTGQVPQVDYIISDTNGSTSASTIDVTVEEPAAPEAAPDHGEGPQGADVTVPVLENDTLTQEGATWDMVTLDGADDQGVLEVEEGTFVVNEDLTVTFTPADGFSGEVPAIGYTATDSHGKSASSTVTILITEVPVVVPPVEPTPEPTEEPTEEPTDEPTPDPSPTTEDPKDPTPAPSSDPGDPAHPADPSDPTDPAHPAPSADGPQNTPSSEPSGTLAQTGFSAGGLGLLASALAAAGAGLAFLGFRRRGIDTRPDRG